MRLLAAILRSCANFCAYVLTAASLVALSAASAFAQGSTDGSTPSGLTPGSPAGSYALSDFDTVNPYNGSLNFRLPLFEVGGRGGAGYPITLHVEKKWTVYKHFEPGVGSFYYADAGWWSEEPIGWRIFSAGKVRIRSAHREQPMGYPVETLTRITFTAPDGTEYELRDQLSNGQPVAPQTGGYNRGRVFVTTDGTSATFYSDWDVRDDPNFGQGYYDDRPDGFLFLRDGTRFRVEDGKIVWMRDRNGNLVTFAYDLYGAVTNITDSLGRQVTITYPSGSVTHTEIGFKGFGGTQRTIKIGQTNLANALRGDFSLQTAAQLFPELHGGGPIDSSVINYVEMPDGRRYQFQYNSYGELARLILPTGGAIEYEWAAGLVGGATSGVFSIGNEKYIYRRVIERKVYPDGGAGSTYAHKMTYSRPETNTTNAGYVTAERCTPSGSTGVCGTGAALLSHTRHYFHGSPRASFGQKTTQYGAYKDGREYKTEVYDTDATTLLRRVEQTFAQRAAVGWWSGDPELAPPNDPRLTETVTTLADANLVSKQTFAYDRYNNVTDTYEYDYGTGAPGGLLRRSHTDFVTTNTAGGVTSDYACDPATTCSSTSINANVIHLRNLVSQQWASPDGTNLASLTTYAYDQSALTDRASITGLCTTYSGSTCYSTNSTAYVTRGNRTGVTAYANAATMSGAVTTSMSYDIAGNVIGKTDGKGYTSYVTYGDSFCNDGGVRCNGTFTSNTYAFPTSTTSPVPDVSTSFGYAAGTFGSTTALTGSTIYDFYTSLTYSTTDANNKTTRYEYGDTLDRPTAEVRPDGSRTDVQYNDTAGNLYVRVLTDLDASRRTETRQYFDGLGRPYRALTYENQDTSNPWLSTDTQYDPLGRVGKASLPYRSTGGATPLTSTQWSNAKRSEHEYDALGRVKKVKTLPDTAAVTTAYTGNSVTVTEQTGKSKKSVSDALGRLKEVYEDPFGYNYLTSYTYDANGNLRTVTQGTQPARVLVYDSLSRLTSASNPESGTVGYGYDQNGNIHTRTDARNVTTTYEYDRLNRNIITSYTNDPANTPTALHKFDQSVNGKGRLYLSQQGGSTTSATYFDQYDVMGRPLVMRQKFETGGVWSADYTVARTYGLAGNVLTQTYPSGRVVSYNYDIAARPGDYNGQAAFAGNLGDGTQRTYASQMRYHEYGGMEQERYGTTTPVYNKSLYNARGQLAEIRVSTHSILSPGNETNWNRGAIINHYSASGWGASGGGSDNNGNLRQQEVYIPNDDAISGYFNVVQYYGYDALNRLISVEDKPSNGSPDFYQTYIYDRWGNRTINVGSTWNAPAPQLTANSSTNRLAPPTGSTMTYDAAGNLTFDNYTGAGTRAYDAENRMASAQDIYGQTSIYTYDGDGRRVRRRVANGAEVWQVYGFGGELLVEYAGGASPSLPQKEYGYRGGKLLVQASAGGATAAPRTNVAAAANGATATASTAYDAYGLTTARAINGSRTYAGSYWNDQTVNTLPDWLQIDFNGTKTINEVDLFFLQDNYATTEPTESMTFTQMGITSFDVQYWTGSAWANVPGGSVTGNNKVWRKLSFAPLTTSKIRVVVNAASDGWSRIVEVEAYETTPNVAAAANGATVTASTAYNAYGLYASNAVNGSRTYAGSYWNDQTANSLPDWLQINFNGTKNISEVDVFSLQDNNGTAEPSETTTFTQYGVTAFDVQYWTGSAWASVPGGSITGNNKVWRKLLFAPVNTSAIRVVVNGASDGWSRIVEVEAYEGTVVSTTGDVRWMVADQLGTPRMVIDQTGSLSGVRRHDYLPFGEEIAADATWRTTGRGYGSDPVRQKFTSYERDAETGLDYAQARYFSSAQGRFVSADPLLTSGRPAAPQTWNRYTYAMNNPLRLTDPSGLMSEIPTDYVTEDGRPVVSCDGQCSGELYSQTIYSGPEDPLPAETGIISLQFFDQPKEPVSENIVEEAVASPVQTGFQIIDNASKVFKQMVYDLSPDFIEVEASLPLLGGGNFSISKDLAVYGGLDVIGGSAGDVDDAVKQIDSLKPRFSFGASVGYIVSESPITPEKRDNAMSGVDLDVTIGPVTGAFPLSGGKPAIKLGVPLAGFGVNTSSSAKLFQF